MVKNLVLSDKIYNISSEEREKKIFLRYLKYLRLKTKGFPNTKVKIKKLRRFDNRFEVEILGPEEVFIYNLLKKEIGTIYQFENVKVGDRYKGLMVDVGKVGFGIFVDCGILNPKTEVLINLHNLREQLCNSKEKSLKEIIKAYDFIENFPLSIQIINIDGEKQQIQGKVDQNTIKLYSKVLNENLEAVFISGETKGQVKKALNRKGHLRDIISIERNGFLENTIILKENTSAPGIIADIGKYLKNCKLSDVRPIKIKNLIEN
jgi:hypothetical protein